MTTPSKTFGAVGFDDDQRAPTFWEILESQFDNCMPVPIHVQLLRDDAKYPEKTRESDMGFDVFCVEEDNWSEPWDGKGGKFVEINPFCGHLFKIGIKVATPKNWGFLVRGRSGLGIKDIDAVKAGVIEGTYRGEWGIYLYNGGNKPHRFHAGDKIAQVLLTPIYKGLIIEADSLPASDRGEKGFGSSGK